VTPQVSVCVPTRDRAESLRRTLHAILRQTFQDFEIIVGDDASTDDTTDVVRDVSDSRIRYLRHANNLGIYPNWNSLVGQARGRFICIYHDHDTYLPTILERSIALLQTHPAMSFVHTAIVLTDKSGAPLDVFANEFQEVTPGPALRERFAETTRNTLCAASTMVRREAYAAAGPFEPAYGLAADRRMWFQLAGLGSVGYVREPQALILGRSRGDPTERFRLADLLGNYRISLEAAAELWPAGNPNRRAAEARLLREVHRDLGVALLKAIVYGTPAEIAERAAVVASAMPRRSAFLVKAALRWPARPVLGALARRLYERSLASRQARAMEFMQRSATLRNYLPASAGRTTGEGY